jgi:hypothetical protein
MKKSWVGSLVIVVLLFVLIVVPAAAAVPEQVGIEDSTGVLDQVWELILSYSKHLLALVGLIILDVLLGIALSIRRKQFDWGSVGDFYYSMVLPMLIGWVGFIVIVRLASAEVLGTEYGVIVGDTVVWMAWLAVVATLGASIIRNAKFLYGTLIPFPVTDSDPSKGEG